MVFLSVARNCSIYARFTSFSPHVLQLYVVFNPSKYNLSMSPLSMLNSSNGLELVVCSGLLASTLCDLFVFIVMISLPVDVSYYVRLFTIISTWVHSYMQVQLMLLGECIKKTSANLLTKYVYMHHNLHV